MSAAEALEAARAAGVALLVEGDSLIVEGEAQPSDGVLDLLLRHKADVIALLRAETAGWSAGDWRAFFDERAGIAEFDGHLHGQEAELRAFECCITEWLNRSPVISHSGRCAWCGGVQTRGGATVLPIGASAAGHAWLHSTCWPEWRQRREAEAGAALACVGILRPEATRRRSSQPQRRGRS